jgi:hypothetical protein
MRRLIIIICLIAVFAAALAIFIVLKIGSREKAMSDSSLIRVEKVAFGKEEHIALGGPLQKIKNALIEFWRSKISRGGFAPSFTGSSAWYQNMVTHTNEPALYIYISRRQPGQGYRSVDAGTARLIDQDGCSFFPTQSGGWDDGILTTPSSPSGMNYSVGWFRFEAFPRRDKSFRLVIDDDRRGARATIGKGGSVEFTIANPAPAPTNADWTIQTLPIAQTHGNVSFILTNAVSRTNLAGPRNSKYLVKSLTTDFDFIEDGVHSTNWLAVDSELYDISGNFLLRNFNSTAALCPREPAWKLRVKFFGSENSHTASNAVWTISGVNVPEPGKYAELDQSRELQGVRIKVGAFGGAGDFTYSNCVVLHNAPLDNSVKRNSATVISWPGNWTGSNSIQKPTFGLKTRKPHLALDLGDLTPDQRFTVRAVDDQGREFYGHKVYDYMPQASRKKSPVRYLEHWYESEGDFVILDLPDDAKTVDLMFCIHTCQTAEFIFKPPPITPAVSKSK